MRPWKFLLPLLATSLCFAAQPDRIAGVINGGQMVALQNHVSPFAQPQNDQGAIDPSFQLRVTMLFTRTPEQQSALEELLAQQQDRKSPNFHKWLTPEQFADQFGLSPNDIAKIRAWLQSQGLTVTYIARGRDFISFSGTAAQVQAAFKTEIHLFNVNGKTHFSNISSPMIPATLSGIAGGFRGMHNFVPHRMSVMHPEYTLSGATTHFLAPADIATIYDINPLYQASTPIDGAGQKMVIVGQTDIYLADLNDFRTDFGLANSINCTANGSDVITSCAAGSTLQFVIPSTATDPGVNAGDLGESDLDLEWAGAIAPNATLIFVTSDLNSGGVDNSMEWAIDNNLAPVVSMSYGLCEAYATPPTLAVQDQEFQKGFSQGMSIFAAAGDSAAATCDGDISDNPSSAQYGQSVSYPASDPYVTAVGGTEFNEGSGTYWNTTNTPPGQGSALSYIPELAWNDTTAAIGQGLGFDGTGGGPSNCENTDGSQLVGGFPFNYCDTPPAGGFAKPAYQTALTPSDGVRDVPDVSFSASNFNDPYIICTAQSETNGSSSTSTCVSGIETALQTYNSAFGGTSASTPVAAGMTVLLNQYLGSTGLGNINTELYQLFTSNPTAFHDIVAGTSSFDGDTSNNVVPCSSGTPTFEPSALRCPTTGSLTFGYSAGSGYDLVTGLGSIDFNVLFQAWKAALAPKFSLTVTPPTSASVSAGSPATYTITVAPIGGATPTVSFTSASCSGLPAGATCSFSPASVILNGTASQTVTVTIATTANMALPSGAQTITITPTGSSITTTVSLTIAATNQSFTIAPKGGTTTYSVPAGQAASVQITVTGTNGFVNTSSNTTALPLNYSCTTGLPSEASCSFSPSQSGVSETALTLSISTTAPTSELRRPFDRANRIFYAMLLPGVFGIVFAAGSRGRGARLLGLIVVLGLSTLWLGACGGSSGSSQNNPGTPPGSYTVTVMATTGAPVGGKALTNSFNITLTVTQ